MTIITLYLSAQLWAAAWCLIAAFCLIAGAERAERRRYLIPVVLCGAFYSLASALGGFLPAEMGGFSDLAALVCILLALAAGSALVFFYGLYMTSSFPVKPVRLVFKVLLCLLPLLTLGAMVYSLFFPLFFRIGEGYAMVKRPLFWLTQTPYALFLLLALLILLRRRTEISRLQQGTNLLFLLILAVASLLRIFLAEEYAPVLLTVLGVLLLFAETMLDLKAKEVTLPPEPRDPAEVMDQLKKDIVLSQLKPFFLSNTITSIYSLCPSNATACRNALAHFSDYLQIVLDSIDREKPVSFQTEVELVEAYFALEELRSPDKLRLDWDLQVKDFRLPAMTVLPLVENAVRHGIGRQEEGGTVWVSTEKDGSDILIRIRDNGAGLDPFSSRADDPKHIGLRNVRERLNSMCRGSLELRSRGVSGAEAIIRLPQGPQGKKL